MGAVLGAQTAKNLPAMWETLGGEDPQKGMAPHSSILAGESHGQRSLAGYSPWGRKESDRTERPTDTHEHAHTGWDEPIGTHVVYQHIRRRQLDSMSF